MPIIFSLIFPSSSRILRDIYFYWFLFIGAAILGIVVTIYLACNFKNVDKIDVLGCYSPLLFLTLYRYFNIIIKRKFNRELTFTDSPYPIIRDNDYGKANRYDFAFQVICGISPLILMIIGDILNK